jgi:hypothetical protein
MIVEKPLIAQATTQHDCLVIFAVLPSVCGCACAAQPRLMAILAQRSRQPSLFCADHDEDPIVSGRDNGYVEALVDPRNPDEACVVREGGRREGRQLCRKT